MRKPSQKVWGPALLTSAALTLLSLTISFLARFFMGQEYNLTLFAIRAGASLSMLLPLSLLVYSRLARWERDYAALVRQTQALAREASTDPLTGLLNRRSFEKQFDLAMKVRKGGTFIIADVDYLKSINDLYGHLAGDDAIQATASALRQVLGPDCLIARVGGDEFCAFLPLASITQTAQLSEQINAAATEEFRRRAEEPRMSLSISIGLQKCTAGTDFRSMIRNTDSELYRKKHGRRAASAGLPEAKATEAPALKQE